MTTIKHPDVTVQLTGKDGNAFAVIGRVQSALRRAGVPDSDISRFRQEAMSGDYDDLLAVCMRWVNCE